ncbi:Asp-tRNA(Asn)/Glu-tRNA(Gln) amidotransferase GatCAB subunit C [archaeon]|nr:Asp-tRNA(Asn)/Glu-tRNA(Gln) amidotransferase GatCAB subunit C [archaeon]|tara:strand:+ start:470 stop:754 length:285 start_codon:yes stop_codon:yes gene_type:complete
MQINKELIQKIAQNARINLTDKEIKEFIPQIKETLKTFSELDKINTDDTKPSFQPLEINNIFQEDTEEPSLPQDIALSNTKHKKNGFFRGPKAL